MVNNSNAHISVEKAQCDISDQAYFQFKAALDKTSGACSNLICGVQVLLCNREIWKSCGWDGKDTNFLNSTAFMKCNCARSSDVSKW